MNILNRAHQLLHLLSCKKLTRKERIEHAIALSSLLLQATHEEKNHKEKKEEEELARIMDDAKARAFLSSLTDIAFRSKSATRTYDQLLFLLNQHGSLQFLKPLDKIKAQLFIHWGSYFPSFFVKALRMLLYKKISKVLDVGKGHKERKAHIVINLNHIGEAILGETEANQRVNTYLNDLQDPLVDYISIKISTLYSQINTAAFKETLDVLIDTFRPLLRMALRHDKFVNLDMEEYKDVDLTLALFQKVLSEEEFYPLKAGIVLQSYLPNAFLLQQKLTAWAIDRCQQGGSPIKIRLVKGANLAMERVESSIRGWELPTFDTKMQTDANYKRMLEFGLEKEHAKCVNIGVASHNLFDIAYALVLRAENQAEAFVGFEMLEGMAGTLQRVVQKLSGTMVLYCPQTDYEHIQNAIAYLMRRLDENGGRENFLRHFFSMKPGSTCFEEQKSLFLKSTELIDTLSMSEKRTQNRFLETTETVRNEPDTDFSSLCNRQWADALYLSARIKKYAPIPLVIGGSELYCATKEGIDPSIPGKILYDYSIADQKLLDLAIECAKAHEQNWQALPYAKKNEILAETAKLFRKQRAELISAMIADSGKTLLEADAEVSEAIDFIEYYRAIWHHEQLKSDIQWQAKGTVLVATPWNFPCSIAVGGIVAALAAGNCVLFKPAPETILVGWKVVSIFWQAGVPKQVLQFISCEDEPTGSYLIANSLIDSVILTGATQTARTFIRLRADLDLHAETGGKNAMIVTAMSDRDLAVRDIIASAFGYSGQKCSACSLVILEKEVFEDEKFQKQLLDAASSLKVCSAWDRGTRVTPLIRPPEGKLLRALTSLEEKESWLLQPKQMADNPHLWSCGIKWNVQPCSFTHQNEFFGPLLGVMKADHLEHAIELANQTPYGLTSGLHSLDEREHALWRSKIVAGNLYINRTITGAIVGRQPFGGTKASSFGSGAKAGGPYYVQQFANAHTTKQTEPKAALKGSLTPLIEQLYAYHLTKEDEEIFFQSCYSYIRWAEKFKNPVDAFHLHGQKNEFYMIPRSKIWLRIEQQATPALPLLQIMAASLICETPLEISSKMKMDLPSVSTIKCFIEDEEALFARHPQALRLLQAPSWHLKQKASEYEVLLQIAPVSSSGRIELHHYLREISLSYDIHRYGYVPEMK